MSGKGSDKVALPPPQSRKRTPGNEIRKRIIDAAEEVYAERGLDGASVRSLTDRAGARLGSISELFGGLNELPRIVIERRHAEIVADRRTRIEAFESPAMAQVIEAYAMPLIERASADPGWKAYSRVWAQLICTFSWDKKLGDAVETDADEFIERILAADPRLTRRQAVWTFIFLIGSVGAICADNGRIDRLSDGRFSSSDFDLITQKLVPYLTGGIEAMLARPDLMEFNPIPVSRRRSQEARDIILDSAERMFAAHGFFGTENGGAIFDHGSGGIVLLRAA